MKVNYIQELNSFYEWLDTNPISDSARNLWNVLMHIWNKSRWKPSFTVAISVLCSKTGLSKSSVIRARANLIENGRIKCDSREGQLSAVYQIIAFHTDTQSGTQTDTKSKDEVQIAFHTDTQSGHKTKFAFHTDTQSGAINKQNSFKQNKYISPNGSSVGLPTSYGEYISFVNSDLGNSDRFRNFLMQYKPTFPEPYMAYWNVIAKKYKEVGVKSITSITGKRELNLLERTKESGFDFVKIIEEALQSEVFMNSECFCFDWFIKDVDNYLDILNGNFNSIANSTGLHELK